MAYQFFEIEITKERPPISISENDSGVAVLLRRNGNPIDFLIEALPTHRELKLAQLAQRISDTAKTKVLEECSPEEKGAPHKKFLFPSLTIAICTKDRTHSLARCLDSLRIAKTNFIDIPSSLEILVIDNAPSDSGTRELVSSLPEVRYVCERKPGLNFARNLALREAQGELLAYLDDDVVVDRGWLSGLFEAWSENPDAAGFTGLVLPYELVTEAQIIFEQRGGWRRGFKKIRYGQTLPGHSLYPGVPSIFGTGANMAFNRETLRKLGGFDEALDTGKPLPGGGDLDIFYRIIRAGYGLQYEPNYLVFHQHRREMKSLCHQYRSWGMTFMAFVVKSYRTDPDNRFQFRRIVVWWFAKQLWQFQKSLLCHHALPPYMILAELWGGIIGVLGEYSRSQKRIEKIRRQAMSGTIR